jgi:hypothetical protein
VEITTLPVVRRIKANVFNAKYGTVVAVAKVARFEFEIPFIEAETRVYRVIDGHTAGPKFLGHLLRMDALWECCLNFWMDGDQSKTISIHVQVGSVGT